VSKLKRKVQFARERGVHVFRWSSYAGRQPEDTVWAGDVGNGKLQKDWAIYAEGEWYPRVGLTKREAVNLAYAISIAKKLKLEVTFG
jgi:hypothetical protein